MFNRVSFVRSSQKHWSCASAVRPFIMLPLLAILAWMPTYVSDARAQAPGPSGYRLASGDKIAVAVLGQKELSGDFTIDAEGNIQLMFIGSVTVSGLVVDQVKNKLTALYADGFISSPQVSVHIAALRPIYVVGAVRKPGGFPFHYGCSVKSAIALAGGIGSEEPTTRAATAEFLGADERLRGLRQTRAELLVRLARLEAQRDEKSEFSVNTSTLGLDATNLSDIIANEKEALQTETQILKSQVKMLQAQKPRLQEEVAALQQQLIAEDRQVELAREQVERNDKLVKQGLSRNATEAELKRAQARHESDRWRITAELSHRQVVMGDVDVRILDVQSQFKRQTAAALQETRQRLKQLDISVPLAAEIRASRLLQAGGVGTTDSSYSMQVTRIVDGAPTTIDVSATTMIEPGDILEVKLQRTETMTMVGADRS